MTVPATNAPPEAIAARAEAQTALATGDSGKANQAYARELAVLSGAPAPGAETPATGQAVATSDSRTPQNASNAPVTIASPLGGQPATVEAWSGEEVESAFKVMSAFDGWPGARANDLRAKWGGDAGANIGYAVAFGDANSDVVDVLSRYGLNGHPAVMEISAMLGRRYAHSAPHAPASSPPQRTKPMNETEAEAHDVELRAVRRQIDEAQRERDSPRASKLYQREQELIAQRQGNRPIVNGIRTS